MNFGEALKFAGVERNPDKRLWTFNYKDQEKKIFKPRVFSTLPDEAYQKKAKGIIENGISALWGASGKKELEHLRGRGLEDKIIKIAGLGCRPGIGIIIPHWTDDGEKVKKIKVRYNDEYLERMEKKSKDPKKKLNRYTYFLKGGWSQPMIWNNRHIVTVIIESELDGWLVHQEAGNLVNIIALGSVGTRPDIEADRLIRNSVLTLNCLDRDASGLKETGKFYSVNYDNVKRWVNIRGKDPTELYQAGINLGVWLEAAFPWRGSLCEDYERGITARVNEEKMSKEVAERKSFQMVLEMEKYLLRWEKKMDERKIS